MNIEWNKITRHSGTLIGIIFLLIISFLVLYFVGQYQDTSSEGLSFRAYPITTLSHLQPVPINFKTNPEAKDFVTLLTEGVKQGPNFAGHYTIVTWMCGTDCSVGYIVDSLTGTIYDLPQEADAGFRFQINSNLLIANPPEDIGSLPDTTSYYLWQNNKFELLHLD